MKQILKTYHLELKVCGPLHIGNGLEIQKKEYVFLDNKRMAGIIDIEKLYLLVKKRHLEKQFERFMLINDRMDLTHWIEENRISNSELEGCLKYKINMGEQRIEKGKLQVMACAKDPYGNPYIPGSSIKGMLRTILLCFELLQHPEKYRKNASHVKEDLLNPARNRKQVLAKNVLEIENKVFYTLKRNEKRIGDAVNDNMSGIIISDSEPLSCEDIILCQKWEHYPDGKCKTINLLRECIKPGAVINCMLTIDTSKSPLTVEKIMEAVKFFYERYYEGFQSKFRGTDRKSDNTVFLGGGSGFVSKTVIYSLFDKNEAVKITQDIFHNIKVPKEHKHARDLGLGVSPHILKCTRYQGKEYMMGECELKIY